MNREEALEILKKYKEESEEDYYVKRARALEMAIKALKQEPYKVSEYDKDHIWYRGVQYISLRRFLEVKSEEKNEPCDNAIRRQDVLDLAKKGVLVSNGNYESVCKAINELPSVIPQPCEDAIDRAEAIKIASGYCHPANIAKELAKLPAVNLQEPVYCDRNICIQNEYNGIGCEDCEVAKSQKLCEDTISRQAVLDIVDSYSESRSNVEDVTQDMISDILALPTVTPQPKTGHWILDDDKEHGRCSECGCKEDLVDGHSSYKWCSNCGAKMSEIPTGSESEE